MTTDPTGGGIDTKYTLEWTDPPLKYQQWTEGYADCNSISKQSYNQIKHSAKFLFNKVRSPAYSEKKEHKNSALNRDKRDNDSETLVAVENSEPSSLNSLGTSSRHAVSIGSHGEVYMHSESVKTQVYDWLPCYYDKDDSDVNNHARINSLDLHLVIPSMNVAGSQAGRDRIFPLLYDRHVDTECKMLLLCKSPKDKLQMYIVGESQANFVDYPLHQDIERYSSIPVDSEDYFVLFDKKISILVVFDYKGELIGEYEVEVCNGAPVFDIKGKHLIFSVGGGSKNSIDKRKLTHIHLSARKNLLNKLIKTFSNTVLDSMFMFSEVSQNKIRRMLEQEGGDINGMQTQPKNAISDDEGIYSDEENEKMNNYREIFVELYNTINYKSAYVRVVQLNTQRTAFQITIPNGCTKVSLSPYDLQFLTASSRGDEIFLWDYTNAPDSVVLMDKFTRGITSAVIERLDWGSGNASIYCLSRQNGSLHCFANESLRNYENMTTRRHSNTSKSGKHGKSMPQTTTPPVSWRMSNLKLKSFTVVRLGFAKDFIIGLNKHNDVLLIDAEKGLVAGIMDHTRFVSITSIGSNKGLLDTLTLHTQNVSPEIEVEPCKPFLPAYNNKNYKFMQVEEVDTGPAFFDDIEGNLRIAKEYSIAGSLHKPRVLQCDSTEVRAINTEVQQPSLDPAPAPADSVSGESAIV
jgi:hypothetical protein